MGNPFLCSGEPCKPQISLDSIAAMTAYTGALKKFSYLRLGEALRMYASKPNKFTVGQMTYEISAYAQYLRRIFRAREEYIAGSQSNLRNLRAYRGVQSYGGHFTT